MLLNSQEVEMTTYPYGISNVAFALKTFNYLIRPMKFIPSIYAIVQEVLALIAYLGQLDWGDVFNLGSVEDDVNAYIARILDYANLFKMMLFFVPGDLLIDVDAFFVPEHTKTTNNAQLGSLRFASVVLLLFAGIPAFLLLWKAAWADLLSGSIWSIAPDTIIRISSAILAAAPAIGFFFQVNAYVPYI